MKINQIILNGIQYDLGDIDYGFDKLIDDNNEFWFSVVGSNPNQDYWEIFMDNMGTEVIVDSIVNNVINNVQAKLVTTIWQDDKNKDILVDLTGTLELLDDCIHYYGTADLDWNDQLGKNVSFDLYIERYDITM